MNSNEPAPPARHEILRRRLFWTVLVLILGLVALVYWSVSHPLPASSISISFIGYTNAPNSAWRFALFAMTNQDHVAVRLRGLSTEVEGDVSLKAPTMNASLPWIVRSNGPPSPLKGRDQLIFAVGEPLEAGRWRVQMRYSRSTIRERLFQFRMTHKVPSFVAKFLPGPPPLTNVTSEWLQHPPGS